jgi:hypothetical protein
MKQIFKGCLILAVISMFLPALAGAVPYNFYNYYNSETDNSLGAIVDVTVTTDGTYNTYAYSVQNVYFDPDQDNDGGPADPITRFEFYLSDPALISGSYTGTGDVAVARIGYTIPPLEPAPGFILPGFFQVYFTRGINAGETSDTFYLTSVYNEGAVEATLWDDGESSSQDVVGALTAPGNNAGSDPVPEPATLLLLGSGLLGMAGYRIRRGKKG